MKTRHLPIIVISFLMFGPLLNASGTLTTSESKIQLLTGKPTYIPGEKIQIIGAFNPNDLIHIDLVNPFDGTKNSTLLQSDNTGHFRTNYVVPYDAVNGTWKILATSGYNRASLGIQVISSNYAIKNENTTHLYGSSGSIIAIKTESSLKQFHSGIKPEYVKCNQNLHLIIKAEDGSFACVTIETGKNLAERGWALNYTDTSNTEMISILTEPGTSEGFYKNGTVTSVWTIDVNIDNFKQSNSLLVLQIYYSNGTLYKTVDLPSNMIQSDGFYKYKLYAAYDIHTTMYYKVVATYNGKIAVTYAPIFLPP